MTDVKRDYKSRMFTMIFSEKKELLGLYNAIANRNYSDPELLTVNTLENAIYMSMKNDLSFVIDMRVSLYEHQSTYNPNMPLRCMLYMSDVYSEITSKENLYGTVLIKIPTPSFVVFYNGVEKRPEREVLRLSDSYMVKDNELSLELVVHVLNINVGYNQKLKSTCKTLSDYAEYVQQIRNYKAKGMTIEEATKLTIDECIRNNVLREFLIKNRSEAMAVSIYEYNEEEHMRMEREQHYAEGLADGELRGLISIVQKKIKKGLSIEAIAEGIEETPEKVKEIIAIMEKKKMC